MAEIEFSGCRREHLEIAREAGARIEAVLSSGKVLQGPEVATFEGEIAQACGRAHAVCVGSGTDALYFALVSLGLGAGDEVLIPDLSFIATASAVLRIGAKPVPVDVDRACNLDLATAAARVTERTRAIVHVQLFGGMGDPAALDGFAAAHGLKVVEDAAQAFGAAYGTRLCGNVGDASALSFDPMKVLSAPGSGGAVLTDSPEVAQRARRLRYHGRESGDYVELGFNSQMPSLTAAVLSLKLKHLPRWTERRRAIAAHYRQCFAGLPVSFPEWDGAVEHVWHKFVLRCANRDGLAAALRKRGVPTMIHYPRPFHREPLIGVRPDEDYPAATAHAVTTLSLPIHSHLTDGEVEHIAEAVRAFFG